MQTVFTEKDSQVEWSKDYTHTPLGDITKVRTSDLPDFELLVGGFPCQAFSIAGKRRGFDDTRGTLFFEIARILKDKRPKYFLLENVKGLLSHDKGKTFKTMFGVLSDLGYDVKWEVLNSKNFVPQNRERIYIKGYFRRECGREVLSPPGTSREADTKMSAKSDAPKIKVVGNFSPTNHYGKKVYSSEGLCPTLCAGSVVKNGLNILEHDEEFLEKSTSRNHQDGRIYSSKRDSSITLNCSGNNRFYIVYDKPVNDNLVELTTTRNNLPHLVLNDKESVYRVRRLTPVECERLQGFPDGWTEFGADGEPISNTQRYKCLGNAVTTNVITHIFNNWDLIC